MSRTNQQNQHSRFMLNHTQPIRQSAEQVKIQTDDSIVGGGGGSQVLTAHPKKATLQQINNINIESNEMLAKQESEANVTMHNKFDRMLPE